MKYEYDADYELSEYKETSIEESKIIYDAVKLNYSSSNKTKSLEWRQTQLKKMKIGLLEMHVELVNSACKDFKVADEVSAEILSVLSEIESAIENLELWSKDEYVSKPLVSKMDQAYIRKEPYGLVLVLCPWNFPIILSLLPMIGCIAAGNAVIVKPSELAPYSAATITKLIHNYLDTDFVQVINGGAEIAEKLLEWRWDFIFYTGNPTVAVNVQIAAAKYLTPTALELGGKNPVFIDPLLPLSELKTVARRITWGKLLNCGQICISPDYILIDPELKDLFVGFVVECIEAFYTSDPKSYKGYSRIVNDTHMKRLVNLLPSSIDDDKVIYGGKYDTKTRYFGPTIIDVSNPDDSNCMKAEIFGPILPIITMNSQNDAMNYAKNQHKPLALYIFSKDKLYVENLIHNISSGGVCVNDVIMQHQISTLPFGGVGNSGIGLYHGKFSLDLFSHKRSILKKSFLEFGNAVRYEPMDFEFASPLLFPHLLYSFQNHDSKFILALDRFIVHFRWTYVFICFVIKYCSGDYDKKML